MNARFFNQLVKGHLLPHFPGFKSSGNGEMVAVPMGHLWRKFYFFSKSYAIDSFLVGVSIVPLYVPADKQCYHSLGRILNQQQMWTWDEANAAGIAKSIVRTMTTEGVGLLNKIVSPLDLALHGPDLFSTEPWPYLEAIAYSWIHAGKFRESEPLLDELVMKLRGVNNPDEMCHVWLSRTEDLLALVKTDPLKAQEQLKEWENQTIRNLQLEKYV